MTWDSGLCCPRCAVSAGLALEQVTLPLPPGVKPQQLWASISHFGVLRKKIMCPQWFHKSPREGPPLTSGSGLEWDRVGPAHRAREGQKKQGSS